MNQRKLAHLLAASATVIAAALFYLNFSSDSSSSSAGTDSASGGPNSVSGSSLVRPDKAENKTPAYVPQVINPEDFTTAPKAHTVQGQLLKVWADRQLPDSEKVERFLQMFPGLPEDGKKIALDYATQLITDDDYPRQRPRLIRMAHSDELREVVMLDMLTRDDSIKMLSLVELMKTPSQVTRGEAREILEAFLERDYGDDPTQWDAPVRQWIAENQGI